MAVRNTPLTDFSQPFDFFSTAHTVTQYFKKVDCNKLSQINIVTQPLHKVTNC